jgi:hypothetical protein
MSMPLPPNWLFWSIESALRRVPPEVSLVALTFLLAGEIVKHRPRRDEAFAYADKACERISRAIDRELPEEPPPPPPRPTLRLVWSQAEPSPRASAGGSPAKRPRPRRRGFGCRRGVCAGCGCWP